jgi:hypothetical protein
MHNCMDGRSISYAPAKLLSIQDRTTDRLHPTQRFEIFADLGKRPFAIIL